MLMQNPFKVDRLIERQGWRGTEARHPELTSWFGFLWVNSIERLYRAVPATSQQRVNWGEQGAGYQLASCNIFVFLAVVFAWEFSLDSTQKHLITTYLLMTKLSVQLG